MRVFKGEKNKETHFTSVLYTLEGVKKGEVTLLSFYSCIVLVCTADVKRRGERLESTGTLEEIVG